MRARAAITDGRRASGVRQPPVEGQVCARAPQDAVLCVLAGGHGCIRRGHPGLLNAYCGRYLCRLVRAVSAYGTAAGACGAKIWR